MVAADRFLMDRYVETSAKASTNVETLFEQIAAEIQQRSAPQPFPLRVRTGGVVCVRVDEEG